MSVGKRIRELRKALNLNQTDFGTPLGLTQSAIGGYENEMRSVSNSTVLAICREYGVREEWLRSGTGDMFQSGQVPASALSEVAQEYNLDAVDVALITEYMKLDTRYRNALKKKIREIFLADEASDPISEAPSTPEELEKKYPPINPHEDHEDVG